MLVCPTSDSSYQTIFRELPEGISSLELIAINHGLSREEIAYLYKHGATLQSVASLINGCLLPAFEKAERSISKAGSIEFWEAFSVERRLHAFFTCSYMFPEVAAEYLSSSFADEVRDRIREVVGRMVLWNEMTSSQSIYRLLNPMPESQRLEFVAGMARPLTDYKSQLLNMERIPQIDSELTLGGFTESSSVLMIGCGPLPLTGLAFALVGARVVIVDRVAEAFDASEPVLSLLPARIQSKFEMVTADARSFSELPDTSHMLVAGLTEGKDHLLELARSQKNTSFTVLLRNPPNNLLQLYYYPLKSTRFFGFENVSTVSIGVEGYNETFVLRPKQE